MVAGPANRDTASRLERIFKGTRDADVRRGSVFGMSIVGDRANVPFLLSVTRDPGADDYTRGAAALALGAIRDGGTLADVVKLCEDGHPRTRGFALAALGCMVDKDDTPALTRLFCHTNFQYEFPTLRVVMEHL
jgi:HEAT repeat protein